MTLLTALMSPLDWNLAATRNALVAIAFIALAFICVGLTISITLFVRGHNVKKAKPFMLTFFGIFLVVLLVPVISILVLDVGYDTATKHGANTRDMTIRFMYDGIKTTPIESTLPEDLSGAIIIYYRFECPDCRAVHNELMQASAGVQNIYFIPSRGEQGAKLIEQYPVDAVPSGIYIRTYTYNGALSYTKKVLYETDANGQILFIPENFQRLIVLQTEGR